MRLSESKLQSIFKSVPEAIVVADGTSCRHQIADGAQRQALHVACLLARQLG